MASLVHHLGRRVVLGVDPGHGLHDLRGADERTLLAVHELRERPVLRLDAETDPLLVTPLLERGVREVFLAIHAVLVLILGRDLFLVDLDLPWQVVRIPLRRLRLLVQLGQRRTAALVVPREDGVGIRVHGVRDLVDVVIGDRKDCFEVVHVGAADDL